ncbi:MAG: hypothetical protein Q4F95_09250 [Oscillospiraceae bacterium]|nr:hypothetical protein [Oscillospiraceae bacterium]
MKKGLNILSWVILIASLFINVIISSKIINQEIIRKDWVRTTATIDSIKMPNCTVRGTFKDNENIAHEEVALYHDYSFNGMDSGPMMSFYGKQTDIMYDSETFEVDRYNKPKPVYLLYLIPLAASLTYVIWYSKQRKKKLDKN